MALAPQYTATVSKFLQTFFGILIISADSRLGMADVFFSSTRSQAATCGLNRSWTLIRLDTSLGVSRKPGAQHVVSQHILCMVCIYIYKRTYSFVCVYMYVCIYYIIYYAIMCTHDRIFIYTYTHLHMHNRFIFNLIYA